MEIVKYCFVADCYVGRMVFKSSDDIVMLWEDDCKLSELARKFKKYIPLSDTRLIKLFISERCIDERRPDRGIWLGMIGLHPNASDLDIFLNNHGVSVNDLFWTDDKLSLEFWETYYKDRLLT